MLLRHVISKKLMVSFLSILFLGCQPQRVNEASNINSTDGSSADQTKKLFVVDCLLPSEVLKRGDHLTYLSVRQPIKTTAGDCEIRGGHYVTNDRASYSSALRVWLPQARRGEADAQVMLGEIYEQGFAGIANAGIAAQWYRKAAEQGSLRAQLNLGHLYEKGLGVEVDLPKALSLYGKALELEKTGLEFTSETEISSRGIANTHPDIDFGNFYALVIGNQQYSQVPTLNTAINDAKAVDKILRLRYGFKTTLLIDANQHQLLAAFNELHKVLTKKDNLLVFYTGHSEIDNSDQSTYWSLSDADVKNSATKLSSHSITQFLNFIKAKHILLVTDSAYSGALTQTPVARLPEKTTEEKRKKWLELMVNRKARTVISSGGLKPEQGNAGGQHSVFAKAFLHTLKQNKGLMEDYDLFRLMSESTRKSASAKGLQQIPQYSAILHTGHEGSPFFLIPKLE